MICGENNSVSDDATASSSVLLEEVSAASRSQQRFLANEMHIGFDREARRRQQAGERDDVIAVEPDPVGELEPARDAAVAFRFAVVVDEAASPFPPQRGVIAARDQARILHRDHGLVIITLERPGLDLAFRALAAVQERVERMQTMIAPRADVAQLRLEFLRRHQLHSTISMPSSAISQPLRST